MRRRRGTSLSQRQQRILDFLRDFYDERGYPPSIREIVNACGISSTSVVDYNLRILQERGYIRRDGPKLSRGIELLGRARNKSVTQVPVLGFIAAGEPIPVPSAENWGASESIDTLDLAGDLLGGKGEVYALKVKGVSMIDALINDGDIVIMKATNYVSNGEMAAVWLKDRREVTLKKVYQEADRVRLQPANSQMDPIYVATDDVEIQGKVVGVVRKL